MQQNHFLGYRLISLAHLKKVEAIVNQRAFSFVVSQVIE